MYQHQFVDNRKIDLPVGKVVCVGRNYSDHIQELKNTTPTSPVLFMKPKEALCDMHLLINIPVGECHNELEVALLIGESLTCCSAEQGVKAVIGIGLGLDLTLRNIQNSLKQKGHPWERAKSFDNSCPVSAFVEPNYFSDWQDIDFILKINQKLRQQGNTGNMLFPIAQLLTEITNHFTLSPGDIVLTGTPSGVGPLNRGDLVEASLAGKLTVKTEIID